MTDTNGPSATGANSSRITMGVVALAAATAATLGTVALTGSGDDGPASAQEEGETGDDIRTIRVSGEATVDVTPDVATVTLGAQHTAPSAKKALDTVSARTSATIDLLKEAGITEADIQTSNLSVSPNYVDDGTIDGFQASNTLSVRTKDIDGLGDLLDEVSGATGDQFRLDGISFSFDDPDAVLEDARAEAVANAREKAGQYIANEDVEIGEIRTIAEQGAGAPPVPYDMALEAADEARSVPIEAGSQELSVDVTVVFELT